MIINHRLNRIEQELSKSKPDYLDLRVRLYNASIGETFSACDYAKRIELMEIVQQNIRVREEGVRYDHTKD